MNKKRKNAGQKSSENLENCIEEIERKRLGEKSPKKGQATKG
jgi:hypothetical protein